MLKSVEGSRCPKCDEFDLETRKRMVEMFGPEEIQLMAMLVSTVLKDRTDLYGRMKADDLKRLQVRRDLDMFGRTLGKLLVGIDPKQLSVVKASIAKRFGIRLDIQHEGCPHSQAAGGASP